jgi:hypothetical protein
MKLDHVANLVGRGKKSAQWQDAHGLLRSGWVKPGGHFSLSALRYLAFIS